MQETETKVDKNLWSSSYDSKTRKLEIDKKRWISGAAE